MSQMSCIRKLIRGGIDYFRWIIKSTSKYPPDHQAHLTHGRTPEVGQKCRQTGTLFTTALPDCENPSYQPTRKGWRREFRNWAILPSSGWGSSFLAVSSRWKARFWKFVNGMACAGFTVSNAIPQYKKLLISKQSPPSGCRQNIYKWWPGYRWDCHL